MMKKLAFLMFAFSIFFLFSCEDDNELQVVLKTHTLSKSVLSGSEGIPEGAYLINQKEAWDTLLPHIYLPDMPTVDSLVDFEKHSVIFVVDEVHPSSMYSVEIQDVLEESEQVVVTAYYGAGVGIFPALSQPYHLVFVRKIEKPLTLRKI